jgi:hypothetical protein
MGRYVFQVWPEGQCSYDVEGQGNGISDARKNVARREGVPINKVFHHTTVSNSKSKKGGFRDDEGEQMTFSWVALGVLILLVLVIKYWWILFLAGMVISTIALLAYYIK